jgi:precorrin-6y C5,15-methyltransferase (decarboxylating) CbiE subunit
MMVAMGNLQIYVVGCGPGNLADITGTAVNTINSATHLIGSKGTLDLFPVHSIPKTEIHHNKQTIYGAIDKIRQGKLTGKVVFLSEGDPAFMGLITELARSFGPMLTIIPGISVLQTAFARIGVDWFGTVMAKAQTENFNVDRSQILKSGKLFVVIGGPPTIKGVLDFFRSLEDPWRMFIFQNLTMQDETLFEVDRNKKNIRVLGKTAVIMIDGSRIPVLK